MIRICPAVYFPLSARRARFSAACLIPPPASSLITPAIFHNSAVVVAAAPPVRVSERNKALSASSACQAAVASAASAATPPPAATRATDINRPSSPAFRAFSASAFAVSDSESSDDSEASLIPRSSSFSRASRLSGPPNASLICPPCCNIIRKGF